MPKQDFIDLDQVFDSLGEAFTEINGSTVQRKTSGYSTVKKPSSTKKIVKENIPTISSKVTNLSFNNRYDAFNKYVDNLVYGDYDVEKRDGFDTSIKHYKEILGKSRDFKHLEEQIVNDISQCQKNKAADNYLAGYYDGLVVLKKIISQSKMACFRKFASKFN